MIAPPKNSKMCPWPLLIAPRAVRFFSLTLFSMAMFFSSAQAQTFTPLYSFTAPDTNGVNIDGVRPTAGLLLSSNTLYGTASAGGGSGNGTIFSLSTNGSNFTILLNFNGGSGSEPHGGLVLAGSTTLYGTTYTGGGSNTFGTVFSINTDGSGFSVLFPFTGSALYTFIGTNATNISSSPYYYAGLTNGAYPYAPLVLSSNTLYGTASVGGGNYFQTNSSSNGFGTFSTRQNGTVFSLNTNGLSFSTNGSGFTNLYSFTAANLGSTNGDGGYPVAGVVLSTNPLDLTNPQVPALFGTTYYGGTNGYGTIFSVNADGSSYTNPPVTNIVTNTIPPNTTNITTNVSPYFVLHHFSYSDGALPQAAMIVSSNTLYGVASVGGTNGNGTIFAINNDGSGFTNIYTFSTMDVGGANSDGAVPRGALVLSSNTLYGTTSRGGTNGYGAIFAINKDGSGFTTLYSFTNGTDGAYPYAGLTYSNNTLYGTTYGGGTGGYGTIFSLSIPLTYTISLSALPSNVATLSGSGTFSSGSSNTVTATATNSYYQFVDWTVNGNVVSSSTNYTFALNQNVSLVANFALLSYTISVGGSPGNAGVQNGGGTFFAGTTNTVTTTVSAGYQFNGWFSKSNTNIILTNSPSYTFILSGSTNLIASFSVLKYTVTTVASPTNGGTITGGGNVQAGLSTTVTATASAGYTFTNWSENGVSVSKSNSYTFLVNSNQTITANFYRPTYTISVTAIPNAADGTVSGGGTFFAGTTNTVKATANSGFKFVNWTASGSPIVLSTSTNYPVVVTNNVTLLAKFTNTGASLPAAAIPTSLQSQTITFPAIPTQTYDPNAAPLVLNATASSGQPVTYSWLSGPATVSSSNTVTITGAGTVVLAANQSGYGSYKAAKPVTVTFLVKKARPKITFPIVPNKTIGVDALEFNITPPTSDSPAPIKVFVKSGAAFAHIIGDNTILLTGKIGTGTVGLEATQVGNANYLPAAPVTTTFTVSNSGQTP